MYNFKDKHIKLFADGVSATDINNLDHKLIDGLTYNPTLFRKLDVLDYLSYISEIVSIYNKKPLSFEVIGDDESDIIKQAFKLSSLSENIYVKIPICYTNGKSTKNCIKELSKNNIKLNITAIFTLDQIKEILPFINESASILSVFAGRIFDTGIDAEKKIYEINKFVHFNSNCDVLWASPRMSYDIIRAIESNTDIITMSYDLINKLKLINKNLIEYSKETVQMFYKDAKNSNYEI